MLEIKNLSVGKILHNVNLTVSDGSRMLLSGMNGSGKTTLVHAIVGNSEYDASGQILIDGTDIMPMPTSMRMRMGIFVGMQHVPELPGLSVMTFLKHSYTSHYGDNVPMSEIMTKLKTAQARLNIPDSWLGRGMNVGFSGGERKRLMFLHLMLLSPKIAILDEPDSGTDADARRIFGEIISEMPQTTFLIISHQTGWFNPTEIVTLQNGEIMSELNKGKE